MREHANLSAMMGFVTYHVAKHLDSGRPGLRPSVAMKLLDPAIKHLGEHPDRGAANTMAEYQGKRPSLYDFEAEWKALDLPILIICGDEDEGCLQPSLWMKKMLPNAGFALFPKTGHTVNLEEPDAFNRELWNFLALAEAGKWTPGGSMAGGASLI